MLRDARGHMQQPWVHYAPASTAILDRSRGPWKSVDSKMFQIKHRFCKFQRVFAITNEILSTKS